MKVETINFNILIINSGGNLMEEMKINKLYDLLERAEKEKDTEAISALRWTIFSLENIWERKY